MSVGARQVATGRDLPYLLSKLLDVPPADLRLMQLNQSVGALPTAVRVGRAA
ncbi:MAG: hypothetical protein AB7Q17_08385 [Phycisphaerae bacterium]